MSITIDGKEYSTDNLTDEQKAMLAAIQQANGAEGLLNFLFSSVRIVKEHNINVLKDELAEVEKEDGE